MMLVKAFAHHTDDEPLFAFRISDDMMNDAVTDTIRDSNPLLWWDFEHEDCGCQRVVALDCCDEPRWECQTVLTDDGEYKDGIRVCREGFGCAEVTENYAPKTTAVYAYAAAHNLPLYDISKA